MWTGFWIERNTAMRLAVTAANLLCSVDAVRLLFGSRDRSCMASTADLAYRSSLIERRYRESGASI